MIYNLTLFHVIVAFCFSIQVYDQFVVFCSSIFLYDLYRTVPLCPFVSPKLAYLPSSKLVEEVPVQP
jgi:hypothetical protein